MRKDFQRERLDEIVELRKSGMTLDAIGKEYGITRERVRQILVRAKCPSEKKQSELNTGLLLSIIYRTGDTFEDAASRIGMTYQSLRNKIVGRTEFKLSEMLALKRAYNLTALEFSLIFLAGK